jgi:hypothetical protein
MSKQGSHIRAVSHTLVYGCHTVLYNVVNSFAPAPTDPPKLMGSNCKGYTVQYTLQYSGGFTKGLFLHTMYGMGSGPGGGKMGKIGGKRRRGR